MKNNHDKTTYKMILVIISALVLTILTTNNVFAQTDHIGLLTVSGEGNDSVGGTLNLYLTIRPGTGQIFIDSLPLSKVDTQITARFATEIACEYLNKDCSQYDFFYTIRSNSVIVGGPSAGAATTILAISMLDNQKLNPDVIMTGTINSGNMIGPVAGIKEKSQAAQDAGYKQVLVPRWDSTREQLNQSNLSIEIIPISTIDEAMYFFTGKNYTKQFKEINTEEYIKFMREIATQLCSKYGSIENGVLILPNMSQEILPIIIIKEKNTDKNKDDNTNNTQKDQFTMAIDAINHQEYYSAASLCFAGNVRITTERNKKLSKEQIKEQSNKLKEEILLFENALDNRTLETIAQLETYMIVKERILDAKNTLKKTENISYTDLAYAQERFNTAKIWSQFFTFPGKKVVINNDALQEVCARKIAEAEERINYLGLYVEREVKKEDIAQAQRYQTAKEYPLCIFTATKTKADADVILSALFISPTNVDQLAQEKLTAGRNAVAEQSSRGIFPILGYSYLEYATTLQREDVYSSLLYAEYSLELSNLEMYFAKKQTRVNITLNWTYVALVSMGVFIGLLLGIFIRRKPQEQDKKTTQKSVQKQNKKGLKKR